VSEYALFRRVQKIQLELGSEEMLWLGRSAFVSTFSSRDYFRSTLPETAKKH